jgi:hypothetical protein
MTSLARKEAYKNTSTERYFERRRANVLQRQRNARRDMSNRIRQLVTGQKTEDSIVSAVAEESMSVTAEDGFKASKRDRAERIDARKAYFSQQFTIPEVNCVS